MSKIFNNDNPLTNGESLFAENFKGNDKVIFDVGTKTESLFTAFPNEVHYFDPDNTFLQDLSNQDNKNTKSYYNNFGLSDIAGTYTYYTKYQSFVKREGLGYSPTVEFQTKTAKSYIEENNIEKIDFLKIDVEGFEFNVIKGFEDKLNIVKNIQFEYGGTFKDADIKLKDITDYLHDNNFTDFCVLYNEGKLPIIDLSDHYNYCNVVCTNNVQN